MNEAEKTQQNKRPSEDSTDRDVKDQNGETFTKATFTSFSMAHALTMLRSRQEQQQKVKEDNRKAEEEEKKEKAKTKRQRRRANQKLSKAKAKARAKAGVDCGELEATTVTSNAEGGPNSDKKDITSKPRASKRKRESLEGEVNKKIKKKRPKKRLKIKNSLSSSIEPKNEDDELIEEISKKPNPFIPRAIMLKKPKSS